MRSVTYSRTAELSQVERTLRDAVEGKGGVVLIRGEPGIGKTHLIECALQRVPKLRRLHASGKEFETDLPFTGLHELCLPLLSSLESLPDPQRGALEVAFAMREGEPPDFFRVGLAVLGLLADAARAQPIVCVVDDAHWLDHASAQVLAFLARRIEHDPVAILFAVRDEGTPELLDGLPELTLSGLENEDALALLTAGLRAPLDEQIRDQILTEARGNPLALLELPRSGSLGELAGGFGLPGALPIPERIQAGYRRSLAALPPDTQRFLLLAAAEPLGDPVLLWRAARECGLASETADPAVAAGLLDIGVRVRFRHPLVRSAIYRSAEPERRRAAHRVLADVTDPEADPDRRAWHRGQSVSQPDERVAEDLVRAAERASARGGLAAGAGFLERATMLTPDPSRRAERALRAAFVKHLAGDDEAAMALLATAKAGPWPDDHGRVFVDLMSAQISVGAGPTERDPADLLEVGRTIAPHHRDKAGQVWIEAFVRAMRAGRLGRPGLLAETAREVAGALAEMPDEPADPSELLLRALAARETEGYAQAVAPMRRAVRAFLDGPEESGCRHPRRVFLAGMAAVDLWELDDWRVLAEREVLLIRRTGALGALPRALENLAHAHIVAGEYRDAEAVLAEAAKFGGRGNRGRPRFGDLILRAWRGDEEEGAALARRMTDSAAEVDGGAALSLVDGARAVLYNGLGRYDDAYEAAAEVCRHGELGISALAPVELAEAAARSGRHRLAEPLIEDFAARTEASGTDLAAGLRLYARAVLDDGSGAEDLYREAVDRLSRTGAAGYLARARLVYGEWLRREGRRGDARAELRGAHDGLADMGAAGFAERAARELTACGENPRRRPVVLPPRDLLTPQELQVARLVAGGATSKEAAARLFVSPRTVHAHLRNIFRKLGITSRRQLRDLPLDPPGEPGAEPEPEKGPAPDAVSG